MTMILDSGYKTLADLQAPLDYQQLFGRGGPVELEIGAGRGDFMVNYAALHPDTNFMAVERKLVVLRKIVTKVQRAGLSNVQVLNVEIRHFMSQYIRLASLDAIHVYFPDPWPKKRHGHRRLMVHAQNVDLLANSLRAGGWLHFRTDVPDYFEIALELLRARTDLVQAEPPADLLAIRTGYEIRFHSHGIPTNAASFQKL
jgi:tRNA (guanine-N7-)-methyltransferase